MKTSHNHHMRPVSSRFALLSGVLAAVVLLVISQQAYSVMSRYKSVSSTPQSPTRTVVVQTAATATPAPTQASSSSPAPTTSSAVQAGAKTDSIVGSTNVAGTEACAPAAYQQPAPLDLALTDKDLTIAVDTPQIYAVSGTTIQELAQQLTACSPKLSGNDVYFAYTNYAASWQYQIRSNEVGLCTVSTAKVGMRIGEVMPKMRDGTTLSGDLNQRWTSFYSGLKIHEDGHVALDKQYATKLLADMQQFPATDCSKIQTLLDALIQQDMAVLAQANDAYDSTTGHGATQGAILQ